MPTGHFKRTEEHKNNISKALRGKPKPWCEKEKIKKVCPCGKEFLLTPGQVREKHGKYCSRDCYYKYRNLFDVSELSHTLKGDRHWNYIGDKAGYKGFHVRVTKIRGKAKICVECGKTEGRIEWANISGKYEDINNYKSLCKKCHYQFDKKRRENE